VLINLGCKRLCLYPVANRTSVNRNTLTVLSKPHTGDIKANGPSKYFSATCCRVDAAARFPFPIPLSPLRARGSRPGVCSGVPTEVYTHQESWDASRTTQLQAGGTFRNNKLSSTWRSLESLVHSRQRPNGAFKEIDFSSHVSIRQQVWSALVVRRLQICIRTSP